jgi:hypothetical protein
MVVALLDCLFCVIFAVGPILLLYAYNDGELRLSVPVLALLGLGTWHALGDRLLRVPMAYFAYGSAAAMLYAGALLRLPLRGLCLLATRLLLRPVATLLRHMTARRMQRRSYALCQRQLQWASIGFTGKCPRIKKNRKDCQQCKLLVNYLIILIIKIKILKLSIKFAFSILQQAQLYKYNDKNEVMPLNNAIAHQWLST